MEQQGTVGGTLGHKNITQQGKQVDDRESKIRHIVIRGWTVDEPQSSQRRFNEKINTIMIHHRDNV